MRDLRTFSSSLVAVVLLALTTQALANDDDDLLKEGLGFHFVSLSLATDAEGVPHRLFMTGNGTFNDRHVAGGGFFNDIVGGFPVSTGSWRATRLISFTKTEHPLNPVGFNLAGILVVEVLLFADNGPPTGMPATLTVVNNLPPPVGIFTGLPEGYFLEVEDGLSYVPATFPGTSFPVGVTAFSVPQGPDPEFSALADDLAFTKELVKRVAGAHGMLFGEDVDK